jgi:hypothetical protein
VNLRLAVGLSAAAAVLALPACGGGGGGGPADQAARGESANVRGSSYEGHGVRFDFPAAWEQGVGSGGVGPGMLWKVSVGYPGTANFVSLTAFPLPVPVSPGEVRADGAELDRAVRETARSLAGEVVDGPDPAELGGFPGYEWRLVFAADRQRTRWVYGFDEDVVYFVECSFAMDGARDLPSGCEQVVDTFELTG